MSEYNMREFVTVMCLVQKAIKELQLSSTQMDNLIVSIHGTDENDNMSVSIYSKEHNMPFSRL